MCLYHTWSDNEGFFLDDIVLWTCAKWMPDLIPHPAVGLWRLKRTRWKWPYHFLWYRNVLFSYITTTLPHGQKSSPVYSGKYWFRWDFFIFSAKRSVLFRKRMIANFWKKGLDSIVSNNSKLLCNLVFPESSRSTWSFKLGNGKVLTNNSSIYVHIITVISPSIQTWS